MVTTEYSKDLLLRDGAMLRLRALRPTECEKLQGLFNRCSPESIRDQVVGARQES